MNTKSLIANKSSFLPSLNVLTAIKKSYGIYLDDNSFKYLFSERNAMGKIKPFLDSLEQPYLVLSRDLVFVEDTKNTEDRLVRLGFVKSTEAFPKIKYFKDIISLTSELFSKRLYQTNYNFEFYLISKEDWSKVYLTQSILQSIGIKEAEHFGKFLKIYKEIKNYIG